MTGTVGDMPYTAPYPETDPSLRGVVSEIVEDSRTQSKEYLEQSRVEQDGE